MRRDGCGNRRDVVGRGAATAADDVDQAAGREFAEQPGHEFGALVVAAEFVRQAGIGMGGYQRVGDAADVGDVGAQVFGAERAVEADSDRFGVAH
jgi:hypothetical protein